MIVLLHIIPCDVSAKLNIAIKTEIRMVGNPLIYLCNGLDLLMVGGHPTPDKTEWGRQTFKHIDLNGEILRFLQALGGIKAGGA